MKINSLKVFGSVVAAALTLSAGALQARADDNVGVLAAVCRLPATAANPAGQITSATVFDLYEAAILNNLPTVESTAPVDAQLAAAVAKVTALDAQYGALLSQQIQVRSKMIRLIAAALAPVKDADTLVHPSGCHIEQLADEDTTSWDPNTQSYGVLVAQEIWNALSPTDQAAVTVHEAVAAIQAKTDTIPNSYGNTLPFAYATVSQLVATIFSSQPVTASLFDGDWGVLRCRDLVFSVQKSGGSDRTFQVEGDLSVCPDQTCASQTTTHLVLTASKPVTVHACGTVLAGGSVELEVTHLGWNMFKGPEFFNINVVDAHTGASAGGTDAETDDVGYIATPFSFVAP